MYPSTEMYFLRIKFELYLQEIEQICKIMTIYLRPSGLHWQI